MTINYTLGKFHIAAVYVDDIKNKVSTDNYITLVIFDDLYSKLYMTQEKVTYVRKINSLSGLLTNKQHSRPFMNIISSIVL